MRSLRQRLAVFGREEGGAGTVMALSTLMLMLMLVALAVDVSNLYRYRAMMQLTADSAAHSGMVALAQTGDPRAAEAAARAMVERNLPEARNGRLVAAGDIRVVFHDIETNRALSLQGGLPGERMANAVVVRLQRSGATGNTLPTLMLRALGQAGWTLAATSVAMIEPTGRCAGRQAMVAQGDISLGQGVALDQGLCLHSQGTIALAPDMDAGSDPAFSLPDTADCTGPCPEAGTGALAEANLILTDVPSHVVGLARGLLDPAGRTAAAGQPDPAARLVAGFFGAHPLDSDLEPLREVGVDIDALETGSVVLLSALQFSSLRDRPAGLIYGVLCPEPRAGEAARQDALGAGDPETTISLVGQPGMPTLQGAILVTSCSLELDARASIEASAVIALHAGPLRLKAEPGARMGALPGTCDAARRGALMTTGPLVLDGSLGLSDMTLIAGGDLSFLPPRPTAPPAPVEGERVLAGLSDPFAAAYADPLAGLLPYDDPEAEAPPEGTEGAGVPAPADPATAAPSVLRPDPPAPARNRALQQGLRLYAGGRILAEGGQLFSPCPQDAASDLMDPPLRRIAHVMPDLDGLLAPVPGPRDPAALPGKPGRTLPAAGEAGAETAGAGTEVVAGAGGSGA